ncbi:MAG: hypothetical protein M1825_005654 [Sarcosagium campestre]|nr:MAG: hypothetical protein M1825_005654 [Sarcosagium campestre]
MKSEKTDSKIHHVSIAPKDAVAILPPKKVIRALFDFEAEPDHRHELSFARGDFFHVIGRENDPDWYEACNPSMPNARGLVPVSYFQVIGRNERDSATSTKSAASAKIPEHDKKYGNRPSSHRLVDESHRVPDNGQVHRRANEAVPNARPMRISKSIGKGSGAMVYGMVIYDFVAQRADELDAAAGEPIIVIAQSNPEWFVAKPIGRLGGPGLIPVSYIEIRDMASGEVVPNPLDAVQRAGVPKVEEWKKLAADYKNSSIALGKFESGNTQQMPQDMERTSVNGGGRPLNGQRDESYILTKNLSSPNSGDYDSSQQETPRQVKIYPKKASIPRWMYGDEKYWYIIETKLSDGSCWELSRYYQDFYDFQINLLDSFKAAAGNEGQPRILPFMPGPVTYVTDQITTGRQQNLDEYITKLLDMPDEISQSDLVCQLFAPRPGDKPLDPRFLAGDYNRLSGVSQQSSTDSPEDPSGQSLRANGYQSSLSAPPPRPSNEQHHSPSISNEMPSHRHAREESDGHDFYDQRQSQSNDGRAGDHSSGSMTKIIKIKYGNEIVLAKGNTEMLFSELIVTVAARTNLDPNTFRLAYEDEQSQQTYPLRDQQSLEAAMRGNQKLILHVLD